MLAELLTSPTVILGCGNTLFGDDGFGPAVIARLEAEGGLPAGALAVDAGTAARELLFDLLLSDRRPGRLIIVDACRLPHLAPGQVVELGLDQLEPAKSNDFSVHHFPSLNLLEELDRRGGVEVRLVALGGAQVPDEVRPGLSPEAAAAVPRACAWIREQLQS